MLEHSKDEARVDYYVLDLSGIEQATQKPRKPLVLKSDEGNINSACIKCMKPQCMHYYDEEYICSAVPGFSANTNDNVCPYDAIGWMADTHDVFINNDICIECGLCASRCPFGAISFEKEGLKVNNNRDNWRYEIVSLDNDVDEKQQECKEAIQKLTEVREFRRGTPEAVLDVYRKMFDKRSSNGQLLCLCRNLMIEVGYNCALRRTGDVYTRADAVYSGHGSMGAVEIEFGEDTLSVARNILDDVAIMAQRYRIPPSENSPIALLATMPNTRQGYYQVVEDIYSVLGIEISTLTIGALLLLVWGNAELIIEANKYGVTFRNASIADDLAKDLNGLELSGYDDTGILMPRK